MKRIDKTAQILNVEDLATLEATAKALASRNPNAKRALTTAPR